MHAVQPAACAPPEKAEPGSTCATRRRASVKTNESPKTMFGLETRRCAAMGTRAHPLDAMAARATTEATTNCRRDGAGRRRGEVFMVTGKGRPRSSVRL